MEFDPAEWDKRQKDRGAYFLQSSLWGDFQTQVGSRPHYLMDTGWSCLLLERKTPLGKYLFAPYGPTLNSNQELAAAIKRLRAYAKDAGYDWLIIEPMIPGGSHILRAQLPKLGARPSSHGREPDLTRIVDLTMSEPELLASISQSTRSLIRKNQREKTLNFKTSANPADIAIFIDMLKAVTERNRVHFFPDDYFYKQAEVLMPAGMMVMETAVLDGKAVASALFHDFGTMSCYTFAASLPEARQTSASALLLYQSMLNSKRRAMTKLDLFGIAPDDAPSSHPWAGFSSFKKKFGGEVVAFAGAWDIPLTSKYRFYRTAQAARRIKGRH